MIATPQPGRQRGRILLSPSLPDLSEESLPFLFHFRDERAGRSRLLVSQVSNSKRTDAGSIPFSVRRWRRHSVKSWSLPSPLMGRPLENRFSAEYTPNVPDDLTSIRRQAKKGLGMRSKKLASGRSRLIRPRGFT